MYEQSYRNPGPSLIARREIIEIYGKIYSWKDAEEYFSANLT